MSLTPPALPGGRCGPPVGPGPGSSNYLNPYVPVRLTPAAVTSGRIGSGQRRSKNFKSRALQSTSRLPGPARPRPCNLKFSARAQVQCAGISCSFFPHTYLSSFHRIFLLMNQAYLLLIYVISDSFQLVSIARSLKCCSQRRSTLMVTNEVSTLADLYCSCWRFCKWAGIALPMFHFAMGWNCSAHVSFSQWTGIGLEFRAL